MESHWLLDVKRGAQKKKKKKSGAKKKIKIKM
jgi:hypothetical protein